MSGSIERRLCDDYLAWSQDEMPLTDCISSFTRKTTIIAAHGFEQRAYGLLWAFANTGVTVDKVILGKYQRGNSFDERHAAIFTELAGRVSRARPVILPNHNDGRWVEAALSHATENLLVDITGMSNRAMFPTLDILEASGRTNKVLSGGRHGQTWASVVAPPDRTGWTKPRRGLPYGDCMASGSGRE